MNVVVWIGDQLNPTSDDHFDVVPRRPAVWTLLCGGCGIRSRRPGLPWPDGPNGPGDLAHIRPTSPTAYLTLPTNLVVNYEYCREYQVSR